LPPLRNLEQTLKDRKPSGVLTIAPAKSLLLPSELLDGENVNSLTGPLKKPFAPHNLLKSDKEIVMNRVIISGAGGRSSSVKNDDSDDESADEDDDGDVQEDGQNTDDGVEYENKIDALYQHNGSVQEMLQNTATEIGSISAGDGEVLFSAAVAYDGADGEKQQQLEQNELPSPISPQAQLTTQLPLKRAASKEVKAIKAKKLVAISELTLPTPVLDSSLDLGHPRLSGGATSQEIKQLAGSNAKSKKL
jgi:hypothetical protein